MRPEICKRLCKSVFVCVCKRCAREAGTNLKTICSLNNMFFPEYAELVNDTREGSVSTDYAQCDATVDLRLLKFACV